MKVLSDIYTYSKDKSSVVFSAGESSKQKKNVSDKSWFSKTWDSTPSLTSTSWFSKMSFPKYQMPKYSFPKCSSLNFSFPKCSFPKFSLPTVWFKSFLVTLEETRVYCYLYLAELFSMIKQKTCVCLNCSCLKCPCLQFNSNPDYVHFPWYKRVMFTIQDNICGLINLTKESVKSNVGEDSEEEDSNLDKKGSKAKVDEERTSRGAVTDDKYNMKHSQSSKYSNDLTTLRSSKKLKKTNTDDLKNGEDASATTKNTAVFSMFSKSDVESKSPKVSSPVNKSGSLYVDANEDKYGDNEDNKTATPVTGEESIPGSNETSEERTKFNIKKTWDKFSKIIS